MSLLSILGIPFLIGLVVTMIAPLFVSAVDRDLGERVGRWYIGMGILLLNGSVLLFREKSRPILKQLGFDGNLSAYTMRLDGKTKYLEDPDGYLGEWFGRPFGIALEDPGIIFSPREADIGIEFDDLQRRGEFTIEDGGDTYRRLHLDLAAGVRRLVNPIHAKHIIRGSGDASIADRVETLAEASQDPFYSRPTFQYITLLIAFGVGLGAIYMAGSVGDDVSTDFAGPSLGMTAVPDVAIDAVVAML